MQKKFLTNLGLLLFLNLLVKPFWVLGIDRSVQNAVGAEDFGFYFSILNFSFLFNIFLDFGITNFNNRNIAQNRQLLNKHFSSILILKVILGLLYMLATFGIGLIIGYSTEQFKMLAWVAFNQFLLSFILYLRSNITGLLLFKTDSFISVLDRLIMILICSVLLWGNVTNQPFRIEWFVYAQTSAYLLTFFIALLIVIKKAAFRKLVWNRPFLIMILKKSFPYALLFLLMMSTYKIDAVLIERLLPGQNGKIQTGIYAQGYRLFDAINMIAYLFSVLLLPLFSRMIKVGDQIEKIVRLSFSLLITISVVVAISSFTYSIEIIELLYPRLSDELATDYSLRLELSSQVFSLFMFGFIAISSTYVFGTLLTANGNIKELNIIAATGMIVSIMLNLYLVPKYLSVGSAWSNLTAQSLMVVAQIFISFRVFKFKRNMAFVYSLASFIAGVVIMAYFSTFVPVNWMYRLSVLIAISVILAMVLRLINIREFYRIIRSEDKF